MSSLDPGPRSAAAPATDDHPEREEEDDETRRVVGSCCGKEVQELLRQRKKFRDPLFNIKVKEKLMGRSRKNDDAVCVWDVSKTARVNASTSPQLVLRGQTGTIAALAALADGRLASVGPGKKDAIRIWNVAEGILDATLKGHVGEVRSLAPLLDGRLASSGLDKSVIIWNLTDSTLKSRLPHTAPVQCLTAIDGNRLASGSWDSAIDIWDLASSEHLHTLAGNKPMVRCLARLSDNRLASGGDDKSIIIWNLTESDGKQHRKLKGHTDSINCLVALDGDRLASNSADNSVIIWNVADGVVDKKLEGHSEKVLCLAKLDGGRLASGGADANIIIWNVAVDSGYELLAVLPGHSGPVRCLAVLDKNRLASGGAYEKKKEFVPGAINDSCKTGVDRFGSRPLAEAIVEVVGGATPPLCVGLYAKWGRGKSYLINQLKQAFDPTVRVDPRGGGQIVQHFEPGYDKLVTDEDPKLDDRASRSTCGKVLDFISNALFYLLTLTLWWFYKRETVITIIDTVAETFNDIGEIGKDLRNRTVGCSSRRQTYEELPMTNGDVVEPYDKIDLKSKSRCLGYVIRLASVTWLAAFISFGVLYPARSAPYSYLLIALFVASLPVRKSSSESGAPISSQKPSRLRRPENDSVKNYRIQLTHRLIRAQAWEYAQSDELWTGLIKKMYAAVELRLSKKDAFTRNTKDRAPDDAQVVTSLARNDWKTAWRVKRAKELLTTADEWSTWGLRLRALLLVLVPPVAATFSLLVLLSGILEFFGASGGFNLFSMITNSFTSVRNFFDLVAASAQIKSRDAFIFERESTTVQSPHGALASRPPFAQVAVTFAPIVAAIATYKAGIKTDEVAGKSRGEVFFEEAKKQDAIKDRLGFLARVKDEVTELFSFLYTLKEETGVELVIVPFVDDLDRVMGGNGDRVTKVLEAVQLILSIDNAPVVTFLAIDPRIVIHSIEDGFGAVIQNAKVTGWEYLDKIVQIPVAIPEPVPIKVERFISRTVVDSSDATPETVAARLRSFAKTARVLATNKPEYAAVFSGSGGDNYRLPLVEVAKKIRDGERVDDEGDNLRLGERGTRRATDLELVRYVASRLDPTKDKEKLIATIKEEGIEETCRALNDMFRTVKIVDKDMKVEVEERTREVARGLWLKVAESQQRTDIAGPGLQTAEQLLSPSFATTGTLDVSLAERWTLQAFAKETSGNPRRVKRVANVFQLAVAYAKRLALDEADQDKTVYFDPRWPLFACKLVKFIVLCEEHPIRMSLLVSLLTDLDQKTRVNKYIDEECKSEDMYKFLADDHKGAPSLDVSMLLATFYYKHVEPLYYLQQDASRNITQDGDPENFAMMLSMKLPKDAIEALPETAKKYDDAGGSDIVVRDIIGMRDIIGQDDTLLLLDYALNLSPALRDTITRDVAQNVSKYEPRLQRSFLGFKSDPHDSSLREGSAQPKADYLLHPPKAPQE